MELLEQVKKWLELGRMFNAVKSKFKGIYLRNSLPKVKNEAYVVNLDECKIDRNSLDRFVCE